MPSRPSRILLICIAGAALAFLVGIALLVASFTYEGLAIPSIISFVAGFALIILTVVLTVRYQKAPKMRPESVASYRFGRITTVITWVITLLHILPLVALLVLVFLLDALDDFNQSWGLLFRGTLVTILLTASLLWLVPWRVRAEATMLQRLGFLVPISIIIAFWILQAL